MRVHFSFALLKNKFLGEKTGTVDISIVYGARGMPNCRSWVKWLKQRKNRYYYQGAWQIFPARRKRYLLFIS